GIHRVLFVDVVLVEVGADLHAHHAGAGHRGRCAEEPGAVEQQRGLAAGDGEVGHRAELGRATQVRTRPERRATEVAAPVARADPLERGVGAAGGRVATEGARGRAVPLTVCDLVKVPDPGAPAGRHVLRCAGPDLPQVFLPGRGALAAVEAAILE